MKEIAQGRSHVVGQRGFVKRAIHQRDPAIACVLVDRKRHVAHPQTRVSPLLDVALRATETADEKLAEPLLGAFEVIRSIHWAEHRVVRHLCIKGSSQAREPLLADPRVNVVFCHNASMSHEDQKSDDAPKSALELAMERLRKKDAAEGIVELALTDAQREEIAEVRRVYAAKIAQEEILYKSKLATTWDPEERSKLEEGYRREVQRMNDERDRKIEKVRNTAG